MGDYVDRGIYGIECIMLLIAIKLNYPETFAMLRGNHECRNMTDHFTFREETIEKYDEEVYNLIMEMFDTLPICGLADKKYFITHGGISPELKKISKINKIDRFIEIPMEGILCDLMWADPIDEKDAKNYEFIENQERDCSYYFGKKPAKKLIDDNNLMTIVRAHQVQIEGYKMHRWDGPTSFPYVITIFSAPNYCDYYSNKGSVLILEEGNVSIKQFDDSEHPYHLPDKIDIFAWSMPFLIEKVISMMKSVYTKWQDEGDDETGSFKEIASDTKDRADKIRGKVKAFARVQKMYKTLTEESEAILKLKGMVPDGKIPKGLLLEGRPAIRDAIVEFERAKELDKRNEKRPKKK